MRHRIDFIPDVAHRDHPDFEARKELAGKALAVLHFDMLPSSGPLTELLETAQHHSTYEAPDNKASFTEFLGRVNEAVALAAERRGQQALSQAALGFKEHADALACAHCTSGQICRGSLLEDPKIVAVQALCLSIVTRMFNALVGLANQFYDQVLPGSSPNLTVMLKTTVTRTDGLGGKTTFPPDDCQQARRAEVTATLPVSTFGRAQLAQLPHLLFHEIFVHSPESWMSPGRRDATEETCAFREGFVEAAAADVLGQALSRGDIELTDYPRANESFAFETRTAHIERASRSSLRAAAMPDIAPIISLRQRGAQLFNRFVNLGQGDLAQLAAAALNSLVSTADHRGAYLAALEDLADQLADKPEDRSERGWMRLVRFTELLRARPIDLEALRLFILPDETLDNLDF